MDVGWPPAVDVIAKGISARFDRSKKVIAVFVSQHSPAAAEIRVYRRDIGIVAMAIASTRIRLPHLDERVGHRLTVAIENVAVDDGLFANRFAGFGVVINQIIIERTKLVTSKRRTGHFRQRVLQRPQWDPRRAQHARLVNRRIRRRVEIAVALMKFGVWRHAVVTPLELDEPLGKPWAARCPNSAECRPRRRHSSPAREPRPPKSRL